uniref:Phosphatidylinositol transfer protein n=1 Tax=Coptotermes formosanus TaxID=36987 RepID=R4V0L3_COPFO|nr:phosphatidylinositol transfer protein [Coptotermes formosanus]
MGDPKMNIVEYRIILPTTVPKYIIGNLFMCVKRTRETASNGEGIEIIKNEPYTNENESGQFTHKIFHFKSQVPGAIRWAVPDKYLHIHEKSHNAYPHFHTLYESPGMKEDFYLLVESMHHTYVKGEEINDNALNLPPEELKIRKVVNLDIIDGKPEAKPELDLHGYICPEGGILEKLEGSPDKAKEDKLPKWIEKYNGDLMVCIKVVKFKFKWFGLQSLVQNHALNNVFPNTFLESYRAVLKWAKDWFPLTIEDIRKMEAELQNEQKSTTFETD